MEKTSKEIYIVTEDLYEGGYGVELYITFASENEQEVIDYVTKRFEKNKWFKAENYYQKIFTNTKQKVYIGGYIE